MERDIALKAVRADITTLTVDAIVNAANSSLLGGGGRGEADLASCYRRALELAAEHAADLAVYTSVLSE